MAVNKVNNDTFQKLVLDNTKTVLVDFYADWCGPCKMLSPIVDQIAAESSDYDVYKLNVDEAPELAIQFGVVSIPTVKVFRGGVCTASLVGLRPKEELEALIR